MSWHRFLRALKASVHLQVRVTIKKLTLIYSDNMLAAKNEDIPFYRIEMDGSTLYR